MIECPTCGQANPEGFQFCGRCATRLTPQADVRRRLATVLFCDVSGSTAMGERLDAETVREVMSRYFSEMRTTIETHGGSLEKFIGDAVMAVFGVPLTREDDALRAVRAAAAMRQRIDALNEELGSRYGASLAVRIGVNSGEVVAGDQTPRQAIVTGDTVNLAARLEQAAEPGQVLLGPLTHRLVAHAVEARTLAPRAMKGKAEPVAAVELIAIRDAAPRPARAMIPLIGRDSDLAVLHTALLEVTERRAARLLTVIGEAGVGKSRLVAELAAGPDAPARVLTGRCLSYGQGITYWPIAEIVRAAAGIGDEDVPDTAVQRIAHLLSGTERELAARRIGQAIGLVAGAAPPAEIAWAVRMLITALAADGTLLLVVDDLQWAESALLDLLDGLAEGIAAPVLIICLARPELLERRPGWPADVGLESLEPADADRLVAALLDADDPASADLAARIVRLAAGLPLFAEELVAMLADDGQLGRVDGRWRAADAAPSLRLPETLGALLGERLDRLEAGPRRLIEAGAVEGEVFHRGAALALVDEAVEPDEAGSELMKRALVVPAVAEFADEVAFRFRHILLRDAAYGTVPKRSRATLHARFAGWLEAKVGERRRTEYEEILGYHLEQAYRYHRQLGPADATTTTLAGRAGELLWSAGRRALLRADPAAEGLLGRAAVLLSDDPPRRAALELDLASGPWNSTKERFVAYRRVQEAARALGDARLGHRARVEEIWLLAYTDPVGASRRVTELEEIAAAQRRLGDDGALARTLRCLAEERLGIGRSAEALAGIEEAIVAARRAGDTMSEEQALARRLVYLSAGPAHAHEQLRAASEVLARPAVGMSLRLLALAIAGRSHAMLGHESEARGSLDELHRLQAETRGSWSGQDDGWAYRLLGDLPRAEEVLRLGMESMLARQNVGLAATSAALLAETLLAAGRVEEAAELADRAETLTAPEDVSAVVPARGVRAEWLARCGRTDEAVAVARDAVALAGTTDWIEGQGEARGHLARVLDAAGLTDEAAMVLREALERLTRKGNLALARLMADPRDVSAI